MKQHFADKLRDIANQTSENDFYIHENLELL